MRLPLILLLLLARTAVFGATYFIDPGKGDDRYAGTSKNQAWKSFMPAGKMIFKAGDQIIVFPGRFDTSLQLSAKGTKAKPVKLWLNPGRYDFYDTHAYRARLAISNTNDVPDGLKAIAIYISQSSNVQVEGRGAQLVMHAKMIEARIDHSENISMAGLSYDYATPTVSEFTVSALTGHTAELVVHKDSHYSVKDSVLYWQGEGWQYKNSWYYQEFNPANGFVTRTGLSFGQSRFQDLGDNHLRVSFAKNPGLTQGMVYQTRDVTRDCAGIFMQRSKNIRLSRVRIYFMHGMGVVSQFCENIRLDSVVVKPRDGSGRTCAAWADILHFSGCRGQIEVRNCYLSAANDDAINVHGVHLRIMDQPAPNQLRLRFMHNQTYGFMPYLPGDTIELVHGSSLQAFGQYVVDKTQMLDEREVLLTLKSPVVAALIKDDAVENISWTPRLHVQHTTITSIPTRGILVTTRRKALIENNQFIRLAGAGVLVADDAESWYESGPVKDLNILSNQFIYCGGPTVDIHPENTLFDGPVHRNITIGKNLFRLKNDVLLSAKSTAGLKLTDNNIEMAPGSDASHLIQLEHCEGLINKGNQIK